MGAAFCCTGFAFLFAVDLAAPVPAFFTGARGVDGLRGVTPFTDGFWAGTAMLIVSILGCKTDRTKAQIILQKMVLAATPDDLYLTQGEGGEAGLVWGACSTSRKPPQLQNLKIAPGCTHSYVIFVLKLADQNGMKTYLQDPGFGKERKAWIRLGWRRLLQAS